MTTDNIKPVAWVRDDGTVINNEEKSKYEYGNGYQTPLYAAPQPVIAPAWVMLTDAEVVATKKSIKYLEGAWADTLDFAEAIQAAFIAKQGAAK
jgi:hypothetical protein